MIICADDFGLNSSVSKGILELAQAGKIDSVSCLVTTENWKKQALDLRSTLGKKEAGLHLTLTYPKPVHFPKSSLGSLALKSYFGFLKKKDLVQEIHLQIELFEKFFGSFPDYIDGHEFCHHLPIVRGALAEVLEGLDLKNISFYVRVFSPGRLPFLKNSFFWTMNHLASWPSKKFKSLLKKKNIPFNVRLLGFHPRQLDPKKYFEYYFSAKPSKKDVFFCHPGLVSKDQQDDLRDYRPKIYDFMMSSQFEDMLKHYQIERRSQLLDSTKEKDVST